MKIGIVVHSQTGNTYSVAERLERILTSSGHSVSIERVEPEDETKMDVKDIKLKSVPYIGDYDALVFGAPVRGFSLSPAMTAYLEQIESLSGIKVACFVTHFLPFSWMGGTRSVGQMKRLSSSKGAAVSVSAVIDWSSGGRERKIDDFLNKTRDSFE